MEEKGTEPFVRGNENVNNCNRNIAEHDCHKAKGAVSHFTTINFALQSEILELERAKGEIGKSSNLLHDA